VLTREGQQVRLRPKTFAMLAYLVAAAGRLVTKKDLLDDLWRDVFVGDAALKTCMREIREALGDDVQRPRFIETAHRRGYRFIAPVAPVADAATDDSAEALFKAPRTRYARTNDVNLAYQVVGSGRSTSCSPPAAFHISTTCGPSRRWRASCGWHRSRG
jgi:DNA-binding winged helix-turn-helix (wHTH) protein